MKTSIGAAVNSIDSNVFKCCPALEEMSVSSYNNSEYKVINNCLVTKDAYLLVTGCKNSTIPNPSTNGPIRYIGSGAFYGCTSLTSISIPGWISRIGAYAFYGCTGLKSVTLLDGVTTIECWAFYCDNLQYVYYIGTVDKFDECLSNSNSNSNSNIFKVAYTCYFYSATQPTDTTGNYWYYDDNGNVAIW